MEPLANIYNRLATKAYNKETRIHTHMHSLFSSQQLPHKTPFNAASNSCLGESPSIPFIAIKRESHAAAVGCHLAPAHCLLQLVHSSKQAATILNLNCLPPPMMCRSVFCHAHVVSAVISQHCRSPCFLKCSVVFAATSPSPACMAEHFSAHCSKQSSVRKCGQRPHTQPLQLPHSRIFLSPC
jgi:hypothetical protein